VERLKKKIRKLLGGWGCLKPSSLSIGPAIALGKQTIADQHLSLCTFMPFYGRQKEKKA
jgi:hypothetical protein